MMATAKREQRATAAGMAAYRANLTVEECPHRQFTAEWFAWVGGHTAASHQEADRACGRLWACQCAACNAARANA